MIERLKRVLSLVLACMIIFAMIPTTARAAEAVEVKVDEEVAEQVAEPEVQVSAEQLQDVGDNTFTEREPNNYTSSADTIYDDYTVDGTVAGSDDDYFKIVPKKSDNLIIVIVGDNSKLKITLLNSSGTALTSATATYQTSSDGSGYYGASIVKSVTANSTYYIKVENSSTSYTNDYVFYVSVHAHSYTASVTPPTCTADGYTTYTCSCGDSYTGNATSRLGHSSKEWVIETDKTCTTDGLRYKLCGACGARFDDEVIPAGHTPSGWIVTEQPTATKTGTLRRVCVACSTVTNTLSVTFGLNVKDGVIVYVTAQGLLIYDSWKLVNGAYYYFDANGEAKTDSLIVSAAGKCYVGADGKMIVNDWKAIDGKWYFFGADGYAVINKWIKDSTGWCYCDAQGAMAVNKWICTSGKWYCLDANGYMVTNKWMKDSTGWVWLGADGAMVTNKWVRDSVGWCYVGADGYALTNTWKADSTGWCYLDANGSMTKNKWICTSGKWYYLDGNGYMVTNKWMKDSTGWVWLGSDGAMVTNKWVKDSVGWSYVGPDGYAVTNTWKKDATGWCYLDSNGSMSKNKWIESNDEWYFVDKNGYMVTNTWKQDSGEWYYFGSDGAMLSKEWCSDGGYWYYFGSDGAMWDNCYGSINDKLYYFYADGKMMANVSFRSGYVGSDGVIGDECWAYLAASDYRTEQRKYSNTKARAGYVHADIYDGSLWVVTIVFYRLGTYDYEIETLHDLNSGSVITDPGDYFDRQADRYYGASRIKWLNKAIQANSMCIVALSQGYISGAYLMQ